MESPDLPTNDNEWKVTYDEKDNPQEQVADGRRILARTLSIPKTMCILSDKDTEISTVTELTSPKMKLPRLGSDTVERVFPVRSVVSFDPTPSPVPQTPSLDKLESPFPAFPFGDAFRTNEVADDGSGGLLQSFPSDTSDQETAPKRPNHLVQMHDQLSHSKLSSSLPRISANNRDSNFIDKSSSTPSVQLQDMICEGAEVLTRNESRPGMQYFEDEIGFSVQPFGALLVLSELDDNIMVQAASTNSEAILGYSPDHLFGLRSIQTILPTSQQTMFLSHVKCVSDDRYDMETCGPEVFLLYMSVDGGALSKRLWCTMHTSKAYQNYIICELEPEIEDFHDSLNAGSTGEVQTALTAGHSTGLSKPYHTERAECRESELLNELPRIIQQISNVQTLEELVQHSMSSVQRLVRFHRFTMYHFDSDRNGIVVADSADASLGMNSFEGLEFLESTFTPQLKKQYLRKKVSFAYRKSKHSADLAYRASTVKAGLDLSHCYLLAASSCSESHTSPPVQACASIGIYVFGKAWGLISCQSYSKSARLHPLIQKTCWLLSETFSSNIERLSYTLPFQVNHSFDCSGEIDTKQHIQSPCGDLLDIFGANYAAASILGETKIFGKPPDSQEALALLEYLRAKELGTVLWSTDILSDFEDLDYAPGFRYLSSLIYIPLSADGQDFITLFREDSENGRGPKEWSAGELGKASMLSLLYRTFPEIWHEKETTMQDNQLMRLLLANAAHEFRTPLNAIINYLEIALDGSINQETRDNLSRSHSASKSLVYIINDLLDLTNAGNGQNLIKDEIFSLSETLCEATNIFWEEARQKHVNLQVVQHASLPAVLGDQRRVRQVITNLISNAVQHTSTGAVTIESCIPTEPCEDGQIAIEVAIHDTGSGMSQDAVETLFCELEQVSNKENAQSSNAYSNKDSSTTTTSTTGAPETKSVLGLGLALIARIVRNMNGQLSLKSEEGKGSCFRIRLNFSLPSKDLPQSATQSITNADLQCNRQGCDAGKSYEAPCDRSPTSNTGAEREGEIQPPDEKGGVPCHCGSPFMSDSAIGRVDNPLVDADISLKNGESRNLTILASGAKVEDKVPLRSGQAEGAREQRSAMNSSSTASASSSSFQTSGIGRGAKPNLTTTGRTLRILIAEDDPINSSIVKKRLEKFGYSIYMTGNGKECASVHRESPVPFDVILMDLQMPIVDGLSATKMIRKHEQQNSNHRSTVFAVSASLVEKDRNVYLDAGFDGWIMKPIDFQRVHVLLGGVLSGERREDALYQPGMWERGGWLGRY
ncbi:hypothetical protein N7454_010919 [Penicillium verhagenii]|nr:hypothetical protein N7454_010919 [Penicillium verhagenii]